MGEFRNLITKRFLASLSSIINNVPWKMLSSSNSGSISYIYDCFVSTVMLRSMFLFLFKVLYVTMWRSGTMLWHCFVFQMTLYMAWWHQMTCDMACWHQITSGGRQDELSGPIRSQYPGHVISVDQSEARWHVTPRWSLPRYCRYCSCHQHGRSGNAGSLTITASK